MSKLQEDRLNEEPLFKSTHQALTFAFSLAGQQSPKTPMTSLMRSQQLGTGKGLSGLDAAAQAGFILAEVCRLSDDQHNVIVARYDRVRHECKCCGQTAPSEEWNAAIDALSHCVELEGVHRKVRLLMVENAIGGRKIEVDQLCESYSLGRSATYKQLATIKTKFRKLENAAMIALDNAFFEKKLLVA